MGEVEEHQAACKHRNIRWVLLFWLAVTKISLIELGFERHIRGSYYPLFIACCFNWSCRCVASSQCHANLTPATLKVTFDDGCEVLSSCCLTTSCDGSQEHLSGRCQYTLVVHPRLYPASRKACLKFTLRLQVRISSFMNCIGSGIFVQYLFKQTFINLNFILKAACLNNQGRRQFSLRAFQWEGRC